MFPRQNNPNRAEYSANFWRFGIVVFSGDVSRWWLKFLKKGFRHCFITLGNGENWVTIDSMLHKTDVVIQPVHGSFDLAQWYQNLGYTVIKINIESVPLTPAPIGFFTCVESVKRIIGIHKLFIITPYSLYKFLKNNKNKKIILDN